MQPSFNPVFNSLVYSPYSKRGYFPGSGSLTDTQLLAAIDPDQMLLIDSTPHYTTAQWSGYEHLLRDAKPTVGTLRTPRAGRCWLFDGTNDYGTITSAALADRTNPLTITAWVKTTSNTANQTILGCGDASLNNAYALTYGYTDNKLEFWHDGSAAVAASSNQSLAGSWHHVAVVRIGVSGNWTITFYVDGVAVGSATTSTNPNGTGTQAFSVGRWGSYASSLFFSGSMRDVRVYSVAKDATAIADIYNQASTPGTYDTTSLLGAWWCEEESGTTGYDWSGNGRHLTLTNITQSTFHASDTGVTYSSANVDGFTRQRNIIAAASQTFNSGWSALNCTVTANTTTGPTGVANADTIAFNGSASQRLNYFTPTDGGSAITGIYVFSVYLKADSAMTFYIWAFDAGGTNKTVTCNLTTSWQRFEVYMTFTGNGDQRLALFADGLGAITVYAADAQVEVGTTATEFQSSGPATTLIVPKISGSSTDVLTRSLEYSGKCPQPGYAPQRVVTGDGSSVYVDLGSTLIPSSSDFSLEFAYYPSGTLTNKGPLTQGNNTGTASRFGLYHLDESTISLLVDHVSGVGTGAVSIAITKDAWSTIRVTKSGSSYTLSVNGTSSSITNTGTITQSTNTQILRYSGCVSGRVSNLKVTTGGTTTYFPLCEGPGSGNTNRDVYYLKSDNTSGVVSSAIVNGTVSTIWANATDYTSGVFNWPLRYGYTVNGSGVIVPAKLNGASDAAGNAIGQSAGGWASGLQNLNCLPYTNPLGVSVGLETSLDPTADRKTTSSSKRRRRNTSGRYDRFGARATAMSDSNASSYFGD